MKDRIMIAALAALAAIIGCCVSLGLNVWYLITLYWFMVSIKWQMR